MAASAIRNDLKLLRKNGPHLADAYSLRYEEPGFWALAGWFRALAGHGEAGQELLAETLRKAAPQIRGEILYAAEYLKLDGALQAVCAPWRKKN
jgi:hypothetical protein